MVDDASNVRTATFGVEMERAAVNNSMNDFKVISSPKFDYEMTDDVDDGRTHDKCDDASQFEFEFVCLILSHKSFTPSCKNFGIHNSTSSPKNRTPKASAMRNGQSLCN